MIDITIVRMNLKMETWNVSKEQQPEQIENSPNPPMVFNTAR